MRKGPPDTKMGWLSKAFSFPALSWADLPQEMAGQTRLFAWTKRRFPQLENLVRPLKIKLSFDRRVEVIVDV